MTLEADMPLGNVYYYFKAKDDIAAAVLEAISLEQKIVFQHLEQEFFPKARLHYFLQYSKQEAKLIALPGCRIGTLCQEFGKEGGLLANLAAKK
jgi:TetR/AcrR family transcriptional repressor of nem operon